MGWYGGGFGRGEDGAVVVEAEIDRSTLLIVDMWQFHVCCIR